MEKPRRVLINLYARLKEKLIVCPGNLEDYGLVRNMRSHDSDIYPDLAAVHRLSSLCRR